MAQRKTTSIEAYIEGPEILQLRKVVVLEGALGIWSGKKSTVLGDRPLFQNLWFSYGMTGYCYRSRGASPSVTTNAIQCHLQLLAKLRLYEAQAMSSYKSLDCTRRLYAAFS